MAKLDFRKVWEFPLIVDPYGSYVWGGGKSRTMAMTFEYGRDATEDKMLNKLRLNVVNCVNGKAKCETEGRWTHNGPDFFLDGEFIFCVRGWGHLTGTGGLHLDEDDAAATQDDFINFIQHKLDGGE